VINHRLNYRTLLSLMSTWCYKYDHRSNIKNAKTLGFLCINVPESFPDKVSDDNMLLSTSSSVSPSNPKVRATFELERTISGIENSKPKYGERVLISVFIPSWNRKVMIDDQLSTSCICLQIIVLPQTNPKLQNYNRLFWPLKMIINVCGKSIQLLLIGNYSIQILKSD
jgi:hypothetical protein